MQEYVKKMMVEKKDLEGKIKKAKKVVTEQPFGINKKQIVLLVDQIKAMEEYLDRLNIRIEYELDEHKDEV